MFRVFFRDVVSGKFDYKDVKSLKDLRSQLKWSADVVTICKLEVK